MVDDAKKHRFEADIPVKAKNAWDTFKGWLGFQKTIQKFSESWQIEDKVLQSSSQVSTDVSELRRRFHDLKFWI